MNQKHTQQHKTVNHTQIGCVCFHILKHDRATDQACSTLCNTTTSVMNNYVTLPHPQMDLLLYLSPSLSAYNLLKPKTCFKRLTLGLSIDYLWGNRVPDLSPTFANPFKK